MKKHPATTYPLPDLFIDTNSAPKSATHSHSSPMYGKTSPPAMSSPNTPNPTIVAAKQTPSKMSDPYMFTPGPHIAPVSRIFSIFLQVFSRLVFNSWVREVWWLGHYLVFKNSDGNSIKSTASEQYDRYFLYSIIIAHVLLFDCQEDYCYRKEPSILFGECCIIQGVSDWPGRIAE